MNLRLVVIGLCLSHDFISYASGKQSAQLQAVKENKRVEIGDAAALHAQVDQMFIYGGNEENTFYSLQEKDKSRVTLSDFYKHFPDQVENFKQQAQAQSYLSDDAHDIIYDNLVCYPENRDIENYTIVGQMPDAENFDTLYHIESAKKRILSAVVNHVRTNHKKVVKQCLTKGLFTTFSKNDIRNPCCDIQMHKSCFKNCKSNNMTQCPNLFCKKTWDQNFYNDVLAKNNSLPSDQVRNVECIICMEPLQNNIGQVPSSSVQSPARKKVKNK